MADMRRRELAKLPLSTPWWALLHHISPCHTAMISSSLAPERSRERRSASWSANKQLRIWPSAVSRVREQFSQNGRVTEAMIPSHPGRVCRELTDQRCAGEEPRAAWSAVMLKPVSRTTVRMSSALTVASRLQPFAPIGMNSMNRSSRPRSRQKTSNSGMSRR